MRTLVVGGEFIRVDGSHYVPERCWRMVQIFSDSLSDPVFGRRFVESDDRALFSAPFDAGRLRVVTPSTPRRPWHTALPDRDWNRSWYEDLVDEVDAVYCRFPSWEGMRIYEIALKQNKIALASIHGDWPGVYRHLAAGAGFPRGPLYGRLARVAHESMLRVAATARVLFCVGQQLFDSYGTHAAAALNCANYLHRESDLRERGDVCQAAPYRILFVGQLESRKGACHLVEAAGLLKAAGFDVELTFVGSGEEQPALEAQAEQLGLGGATRFLGYVPFGRDLLDLYSEADLFALPAVAGEGLPKVLVEAMSQGVPVVATDVGSSRHLLEEAETGWVVAPADAAALAAGLRKIIEDADGRGAMIRAGLDYARRTTVDAQRERVRQKLVETVPELV
jgi:glycosyltransferase involved in cell wall biosynthesis